ncbi:hypothetical protein ACI3L1_06750 [Deinococcus sp. SM5_A1]|uniref:hypothetical protein n=1 Tax=Deinococcus sp. SM5_A1 TaxID=3379094 RepID=UPI00385D44E2
MPILILQQPTGNLPPALGGTVDFAAQSALVIVQEVLFVADPMPDVQTCEVFFAAQGLPLWTPQ